MLKIKTACTKYEILSNISTYLPTISVETTRVTRRFYRVTTMMKTKKRFL